MREALNRWLKKQGVDLSIDTAHLLCDSLGLDGEKIDSCLGLCYQLEKGEINEADFTGGLCVLTSKKPEEVAEILKGMKHEEIEGSPSIKKVIEPFNILLDAFWEYDIKGVERMIRKLDADSLKKLYGMEITTTDKPLFPHPKTGELMAGDTRFFRGKPYLIILGSKPTCRILYHEVAHAIGIDDEEEAMEFAKQKERELC